ncbi:hypothetical protein BB561_002493 [Smittium simulii]|uniref:Uncharacterized protein n=1 Tax=Smittium simulii TaxID=133385 RepID=A0A2T9YQD0_9FUNG|nr:hypothetical protein BB561_002493 [Smittium simulii]
MSADDEFVEVRSEKSYGNDDDISYMGYDEEIDNDGTHGLVRAIVSIEDDTSLPHVNANRASIGKWKCWSWNWVYIPGLDYNNWVWNDTPYNAAMVCCKCICWVCFSSMDSNTHSVLY